MTSIVRWSVDKVGRSRSWDTAARCGPRGTGRGAGRASPGQLGPRGGRAGSRRAWGRLEGGASTLSAIWARGRPGRRRADLRVEEDGPGPAARRPVTACVTRHGPGRGAQAGLWRVHVGRTVSPGARCPPLGPSGGGGAGYRARVASRALGGGVRLPAGLGLPAAPQRAVGAGGGSLAPAGESGLVLMLPLFQWEASV